MNNRMQVINDLIKSQDYKDYLEIGFEYGVSFHAIICENKTAVDPRPKGGGCTHAMTSDEFFAQNKDKFDIILIDGDHSHEQSLRDAMNAKKALREGGRIVFHDTHPYNAHQAKPDFTGGEWCGEVYKTMIHLYSTGESFYTYKFDYGVTVWNPHAPMVDVVDPINEYSYEVFDANRELILNLVK